MGDASTSTRVLDDEGFRALIGGILAGHTTLGPRVRDGSVVLSELRSVDEMARGVTLEQAPGSCRVVPLPDGDRRRFAWAVGPHSAKSVQHPAERVLFRAEVDDKGFTVLSDGDLPATSSGAVPSAGRPLAVVGLRPCDVAATGVLDRVLGTEAMGGVDPLVVVVNCTDPGGTCFCASMDTGPALPRGRLDAADLVLWERTDEAGLTYLLTHASSRGESLLDAVPLRGASDADLEWADRARQDAVASMGHTLDTHELPERLSATLGSGRWDDIARRCLSCGNCTMVCPTCFCASVHDDSSLDGTEVSRIQQWDSCFSLDHSFIHGGSVRSATSDRYRQWLTHKLSSWWGQFGESGCVGCGRCIAWCPVGIDLVEEATALRAEAAADRAVSRAAGPGGTRPDEAAGMPTMSVTEVLVRRREHAVDGGPR